MAGNAKKWGLLIAVGLLSMLITAQPWAYAQEPAWPPFSFYLIPSYDQQDGTINYDVSLYGQDGWRAGDVAIKIPLPPGTQFVQGGSPHPDTSVTFDGAEITVFQALFNEELVDVSFTVKVLDPAQTEYTARAWISWKGDQAGDYLTDEETIDISKIPLNWEQPKSFLHLHSYAVADGETITYSLYASNEGWLRMWDVTINTPLPSGAVLLSTETPPTFSASSDGQEISFFTVELTGNAEPEALRFTVSNPADGDGMLSTRSYAFWRNEGWGVGSRYPGEGAWSTGYLVLRPGVSQLATSDPIGDVPFAYYDLTSVSLEPAADAVQVIFYTINDINTAQFPVEFRLFLDTDCQADTGGYDWRSDLGPEYRARYDHQTGEASLYRWSVEDNWWRAIEAIPFSVAPDGRTVSMRVPYGLINSDGSTCWVAETRIFTEIYDTDPPPDQVIYNQDTLLTLPSSPAPQQSIPTSLPASTPAPEAAAAPAENVFPETLPLTGEREFRPFSSFWPLFYVLGLAALLSGLAWHSRGPRRP